MARMAGPDIILLVVGALLFGSATYAIAQQPGGLTGSTSAAGLFSVTFEAAETEAGEAPVATFRSGSVTFDLEDQNVTTVSFDAVCTDPASAAVPFTITISVTPPAGIPAPEPQTGACGGTITVEVPVAPLPEGASVPATTEEEARANLAMQDNATAAVGTWTVDYSGARSGGGQPLPIPGVAGDPGGSIALRIEQWTPRFTPGSR